VLRSLTQSGSSCLRWQYNGFAQVSNCSQMLACQTLPCNARLSAMHVQIFRFSSMPKSLAALMFFATVAGLAR